jgi:hypothetical protein
MRRASLPSAVLWQRYHEMLASLEARGVVRRPVVPEGCRHNGHMYYVLLGPVVDRRAILDTLNRNGIQAVFHYVPLHSSPAGLHYGRAHGDLALTTSVSQRLIGEFSYPIYLVHITVWYFVQPRFLIVACMVASAPLVFLVEMPLERWRNNRLRAMSMNSLIQSAKV